MEEKSNKTQQELLEELEDIITVLAQQTDSKNTNLQVDIEEKTRVLEERDQRRWGWFLGIALTIFVSLGVLSIEMWERQFDRIVLSEKNLIKLEQSIDNVIKNQIEMLKAKDAECEKKNQDLSDRLHSLEKSMTSGKK